MAFWSKIDVKRKETLPPLSEAVCMYTKDDGYFVATVYTQEDTRGRAMYYYKPDRYSTKHTGSIALRGKSVWWCALVDSWGWTRMRLDFRKATDYVFGNTILWHLHNKNNDIIEWVALPYWYAEKKHLI